jgi:hypothetical protein
MIMGQQRDPEEVTNLSKAQRWKPENKPSRQKDKKTKAGGSEVKNNRKGCPGQTLGMRAHCTWFSFAYKAGY